MTEQKSNQQTDLVLQEVQEAKGGKVIDMEPARHRDTLCGVGTCVPSGAQRCANIALFTASAGVASLCLQMARSYLSSQITSIEKQFGLSSTASGILLSCNDIGFFTTVLIFSHFGRKGHIPRVLAMTGFIYGLTGIVCGLPQFIEPASLPEAGTDGNISSLHRRNYLCPSEGTKKTTNETCTVDESRGTGSGQWLVYLLATALFVQGIAKSSWTPLATEYIDNNVHDKMRTGLYLGTYSTMSLFGPGISYLFGGIFSSLPVDLQDTLLTPRDTRWIGAWWLGFLVCAGIIMISMSPLVFFPRRLKGSWKEQKDGKYEKEGKNTFSQKIRGLFLSVMRVLKNPIYTLSLVGCTVVIFSVGGFFSFGPKYLENVFLIPSWKANFIQGIQAAVAGATGTFLGGYVTTRFKLNALGCLKFVIGVIITAATGEAITLLLGCHHPSIAGLQPNTSLAQDSGAACECSDVKYLPVCGVSTQTTYFSPCHAGCLVQNGTKYGNCIFETGRDVTLGMCDTGCPYLYPYVVVSLLTTLLLSMSIVPINILLLRCVKDEDKTMAMGILSFSLSLFGFIPAPIVYGKVYDSTCRLWNFSCGIRGSCALNDIVDMRMKKCGLNVGLWAAELILFIAAFLNKRCDAHADESEVSNDDGKESVKEGTI